jgi:uncharacterized membrane protein YsdA (DUF1294 family)
MLTKIILIYWLCSCLVAFILMYWDKRQAQKQAWRVAEKRFFILAAVGGSIGVLAAMPILRHKNRKNSFKMPIYGIVVAQVAVIYFLNTLKLF